MREKSEEEVLDLTVEDQNHAQRRDEFDADFEEAIGTHLMAGEMPFEPRPSMHTSRQSTAMATDAMKE